MNQESLDALKRKLADLEAEVIRMRAQAESYKFLTEDTKEFRRFVQQERHEDRLTLETLMKWGSVGAGLLTGLFGGFLSFLGWKTWADAKEQIKRSTEAIQKNSEEQIQRSSEAIQKDAGQHLIRIREEAAGQLQRLVESSVAGVRENVQALDTLIRRELQYQRSRVLVVGRPDGLEGMAEEVALLERKGIQVTRASHPVDDLPGRIRRAEIDIVLYRYHPDIGFDLDGKALPPVDPAFRPTLDAIVESGHPVPVLVYATSAVTGGDNEAFRAYRWGTFANTAATVVSHVYMLAHLFQGGQQQ